MRIFEHLKKMKVESNTSTIFYAIHLDKQHTPFQFSNVRCFKMSPTVFWRYIQVYVVGSFLADVIKENKYIGGGETYVLFEGKRTIPN